MSAPFLRVADLTKRFGAVMALNAVDLAVQRGEIVALLGDNGAGKSTLIKCVSGVHRPDAGVVELDGRPVSFRSPTDARKLGIETVYQDLALFDNLDTVSNFYAGRELQWPHGRFVPRGLGIGRRALMRRRTREALERLEVRVKDHTTPVGLLSGGQRQAIAVGRAVSFASRLVILDEPTAALGVRESRNVIELIRRLPREGLAVLLVSHNLDHVAQLAHRAVVLRQGTRIGEAVPNAQNHERLVAMIVGATNGPHMGRRTDSHEVVR